MRSYAPVPVLTYYPAPKEYQDSQAGTGDASYAFGFDTDSYKRQETSDARGNIKGSYSYADQAGTHDLSYVAGEGTGFVATSGSLSRANGLDGNNVQSLASFPATTPSSGVSYSFGYSASGSEIPSTIPNTATSLYSAPTTYETSTSANSEDDLANTGDASYNFVIDTDEYKRTETSDASGNVQGSFSYKNAAGTHDLSYVAGTGTGFVATGGSLSNPNEISKTIANLPYNTQTVVVSAPSRGAFSQSTASGRGAGQEEQSSGDASYSFAFDTGEYKRQESSDAAGNVQGNYAYKNSVGSHDLSYVAGSATGFQSTGGSLSVPPGLNEAQLRLGEELAKSGQISKTQITPSVGNSITASTNSGYSLGKGAVLRTYLPPSVPNDDVKVAPSVGNSLLASLGNGAIVRTYLPPYNEKGKFGYIYEAQF